MKKTNSKKTTSMRVAAAMLALTLITSCFAGGTFARYTTSASGGDSARVANFGVKIDAGKSTFLDEYETTDTSYTGAYSVASSNGDKVVAPGTSGEIDLFSISGTPEVAVRIDVKMDEVESVMIKPIISFVKVTVHEWEDGGSFNVGINPDGSTTITKDETRETIDATDLSVRPQDKKWTETKESDDGWGDPVEHTYTEKYESNSGDAYYPIKWTLIKNGAAVEGVTDVTLTEVKNYIDENINGTECKPFTDLSTISGTYKLQWKWDYEGDNEATKVAYDTYDTHLGNIAAGKYGIYLSKEENEKSENKEYNLTEAFKFSVTVTQID